jgi:lysophospholipase L1-like esterase
MLKERLAKLGGEPLDYGLYGQPVRVNADDVEWLVDLYKKRLNQIAQICAERHIRVIYASEAERFFRADLNERSSQSPEALAELGGKVRRDGQLTIAELEAYLQGRLNRAAREVAAEQNALFFDGEQALLADKAHIFADQIHPNEIGAARLAKGLEEVLRPVVQPAAPAR